MELSEILNHFPKKFHFLKDILEVIIKCIDSSFSLFRGGKKKCFPSPCGSSVTKEIEDTIFQRIKIDQRHTNHL